MRRSGTPTTISGFSIPTAPAALPIAIGGVAQYWPTRGAEILKVEIWCDAIQAVTGLVDTIDQCLIFFSKDGLTAGVVGPAVGSIISVHPSSGAATIPASPTNPGIFIVYPNLAQFSSTCWEDYISFGLSILSITGPPANSTLTGVNIKVTPIYLSPASG
jgi:hypothetical protein